MRRCCFHVHQSGLPIILILLQYFRFISAGQDVECYYPNGTALAEKNDPNNYFQKCSTSLNNDNVFMCCKGADPFNDVCQPNGLCARKSDPKLGLVQGLLRIGCTDPSYTSSSCLKLCDKGGQGSGQFVKQCPDGSFCCEGDTSDLNATETAAVDACCSQGHGKFILPNGTISDTNPTASPSNTSTNSPTPTPALSSESPTPKPKSNDHAGAIAGGVVGGVVGLAILAGLLFFFLRRRQRKGADAANQPFMPGSNALEKSDNLYAQNSIGKHEISADDRPYESDGNMMHEKDATGAREDGQGPHEVPAENLHR